MNMLFHGLAVILLLFFTTHDGTTGVFETQSVNSLEQKACSSKNINSEKVPFIKEKSNKTSLIKAGEEVYETIVATHAHLNATGVWEKTLHWANASYISIHFSAFNLAAGDYVEISSPDGRYRYQYEGKGKVVRGGAAILSEFWATHIPGDTVIIRFHSSNPKGDYGFEIDKWVHGYEAEKLQNSFNYPQEGNIEAICGTDDKSWAPCYKGIDLYEQSKTVARLLIQGSSFCTGWLWGNEGHLMTNNHCISSQLDADNTDYEFMAEGLTCNTNCPSGQCAGTVEASSGTLVQTDSALDYALIKLPTNLTSQYGYLKVRDTLPDVAERIYIPQHPGGKGKQIAVDDTSIGGYCEVDSTTETPCSGGSGDVGYYCDTEGGSSGSPVIAYDDQCVVALHHCADCPNRGVRFTEIITNLGSKVPDDAVLPAGTSCIILTQWEKTFGDTSSDYGHSVQQTIDGGYIIAGSTNSFGAVGSDVYLIKTDGNGDTQWFKTFGGANSDYGHSVQQTTDGGYIIAGYTSSFGAGSSDVYLIKTDSTGNAEWSKTFGGPGTDYGYSVQQTTDGGYIIAGTYSYADIYLIKTDSNGETEWAKAFGGHDDDVGYSVQQTTDGGYIVAGDYGNKAYLLKTDSNGNEQWSQVLGGSNGRSVQQTSDGGYIVAGDYGSKAYLVKTDSDGNELWNQSFSGMYEAYGKSAQQTTDGGYIVAGHTQLKYGKDDIYLIKTDDNGNELWSETFGCSSYDYGYSVQQTTDGGYIVAGQTDSYGAGSYDIYLIKTKGSNAVPDIKANNSDYPIFTTPQKTVEITMSLIPNKQRDVTMDWWIGAFAPFGTYWYNSSQRWVKSGKPISFGQTPLDDMPNTSILTYKLPIGPYYFFFVLDDNPNGSLDKIMAIDDVVVVSNSVALALGKTQLNEFKTLSKEKVEALVK